MDNTFNKQISKNPHPRPTITPFAKKVWMAASLRMFHHFKELGIEQYAVCYLQMPKLNTKHSWASLEFELEDEEE